MRSYLSIAAMWIVWVLSGPASGSVLTVPTQFPTIQAAIDASVNGDTVMVEPGTYTGPGNRDLDPGGKSIVVTSSLGSAMTILDVQGSALAPHRGFSLTAAGSSPDVSGFTIRNGNQVHGGGVLVEGDVSATLTDVVVEHCDADETGGGFCVRLGAFSTFSQCVARFNQARFGGGIDVSLGASTTLVGCQASDNVATERGGGLHVNGFGVAAGTMSADFLKCDFDRNTSANAGGGVLLSFDVQATFDECRIRDNSASSGSPGWGGGMIIEFEVSAVMTDCEIAENEADRGGGIFLWQDSVAHLVGCELRANHAISNGGGMEMIPTTPYVTRLEMDDCVVEGNLADRLAAGLLIGGEVTARVRTSAIRNNVVGPLFPAWGGGAVTQFRCDALFEDCVFESNQAGSGAGLFIQQDGEAVVRRCSFLSNKATDDGGAVRLNGQGLVPYATYLEMTDSLVASNTVDERGAGLSAFGPVRAKFDGVCFRGNSATVGMSRRGGAIFAEWGADLEFVNTDFLENVADSGGGLFVNTATSVDLIVCVVESNTAVGDAGGAMVNGGSTIMLDRTTVRENSAGGDGGGLLVSEGQLFSSNSPLLDNHATNGGGIMVRALGSAVLSHATVAGNTATTGGGVAEQGGRTVLTGSIVYANSPPFFVQAGGLTAVYSDLESALPGVGNVNLDPNFVDPIGGDYRLSAGSPCIDAADSTANPGTLDVNGAPRAHDDPSVPDTGFGSSPIVDMGSHEHHAKGPFHAYGDGCAGSGVVPPRLAVSGDPFPGGTIDLRIDKARGGSLAFLLLGLAPASAPLGGGCSLLVQPVLPSVIGPLPLSGTPTAGFGSLGFSVPLPGSASQASVAIQAFVQDPGAPAGFRASNGFQLSIQ